MGHHSHRLLDHKLRVDHPRLSTRWKFNIRLPPDRQRQPRRHNQRQLGIPRHALRFGSETHRSHRLQLGLLHVHLHFPLHLLPADNGVRRLCQRLQMGVQRCRAFVQVTYTGTPQFVMDLQTTIDSPSLFSPNVLSSGFSLPSFPLDTLRDSIGNTVTPVLTRESDNGNCATSATSACVIVWRVVVPQLTLGQVSGSTTAFDTQYAGKYAFQWTTQAEGDKLAADIYVDVSAADPSTNLSQVPVASSVGFYANQADMQNTTNSGQVLPLFSSGEKVWVRHSFSVDPSDITSFVFTLKSAYVCWSNVPGFSPSLANGRTGCSADIPGVMEAANGQRYVLYDTTDLPTGIADQTSTANGKQTKVWGWTIVPPSDAAWTAGATVNNGFGINAQPLAVDSVTRTYYFHVISTVAQSALGRRRSAGPLATTVHHQIYRMVNNQPSSNLNGVVIAGATSDSSPASTSSSFLMDLFETANSLF